ncbi:MAG: NAD-dependent epimerase/dehydratase family protein [Bacteroidales bacterium]|nr:NAD-dependent epimerase/dehydratase family protein [Bacteroidales bacterium]MBN2820089.1 NAD-dependent epimerase/dehydratase family protein [Bacteroidales bacterium]
MKTFVTGGAGFIASNLADALLKQGNEVIVYDNLSTGQEMFIEHNLANSKYTFIKGDVLDKELLHKKMQGCDTVFHFQANADVRGGMENTQIDLNQNIIGTHNVLEGMRIHGIKRIAFASSATVYGEPEEIPTPENISPVQTSIYGASKYSAEAIIQAYCEYFDIKSWIFRFVSFMGPRYSHGVIFDFMKKLNQNPSTLHILGDGSQRKSYLHVEDGINAILMAMEKAKEKTNIFNLGNREWINVTDLADILCETLSLKDVKYTFAGGVRGWKGDTPFVHLDIQKISSLGWKPKYSVEETIKMTIEYLKENQNLLEAR